MVAASSIGWGSYKNYEGPFFRGTSAFVLPEDPRPSDKIMAVITATEGGHYDAWNGYDACGWTSGIIQWCERGQYSISDMLGAVAVKNSALLQSIQDYAKHAGGQFKRNAKGNFRFFFDSTGEVDTQAEQLRLFYIHGNGTKGTWDDAAKANARQWAAVISSLWEDAGAQAVQVTFTSQRLGLFMLPAAKALFGQAPDTPIAAGAKAAYLSFAANNPTWANSSLKKALAASAHLTPWTNEWVIELLKELTFGPQVAIYPGRYNAIRPALERIYGLELPDFAKELQVWTETTGMLPNISTKDIQRALLMLGYDLGPKGADGIYGGKTKEAVMTFEQLSGMVPQPNIDGVVDIYTYPALKSAMDAKGLPFPLPVS